MHRRDGVNGANMDESCSYKGTGRRGIYMNKESSSRYLGIDIGGTAVKFGIMDAEGSILDRASFPVDFDGYRTPILTTVLARAEEFAGGRVRNGEIRAIGVSATGQIDSHRGTVIGAAGHLPNYIGSEIGPELKKCFGLPVYTANDANCALLGELWLGAARGLTDVVMVTLGTGVGGGILANGRLLAGNRGLGGEIGHIIIREEGELCSCGNRGCLEHYASSTALVRRVKEEMIRGNIDRKLFEMQSAAQGKLTGEETGFPDGKAIFDVIRNGAEDAYSGDLAALKTVVSRWEDDIAAGLVSLVHIFEPQKILIGGGVSAAGDCLMNPLREKVLSRVMPRFADQLEIEPAALRNDAGLAGAVYYAISEEQKI